MLMAIAHFNSQISRADRLFHLVMVKERMAESLILLRDLLCGEDGDVLSLRLNAREREEVSERGGE